MSALLPLGLALALSAWSNLADLDRSAEELSRRQALSGARAVNNSLSRNSMSIKIAANGVIMLEGRDPCAETALALALTPTVTPRFAIRDAEGDVICTYRGFPMVKPALKVGPGTVRMWVSPEDRVVYYRVGIIGGMVTGNQTSSELASEVRRIENGISAMTISDGSNRLAILGDNSETQGPGFRHRQFQIADGQLKVEVVTKVDPPTWLDRFSVLFPLLILAAAVVLSWYFVKRLLLRPLEKLQRAVNDYRPGSHLVLPDDLGSTEEIDKLGGAFERAVERIEQSESGMAEALEGQRRLVREVHHRVKNNLQVIASMLSIHGRSAVTPESRAAYAAMGRRVDALSVVHRNHFADVEETRGIALRPLLVELAATLRASAPDPARPPSIHIEVDNLYTTQDAAVAVSFFVTEVVEYVMLAAPAAMIEVDLRRTSELAATLSVASETLIRPSSGEETSERRQFDRVSQGLARQLRSPLDEKLARMAVDLPVFPN
ncbi:MAG: histidine kinase dimerization/phosphoacceptor domain -containing protein [Sphingomicrobium sp.]